MKQSKINDQIAELKVHADHYEMKTGRKDSLWHDRIEVLKQVNPKKRETLASEDKENA